MNVLLNYIKKNEIINDKNISRSYGDINISGVLNFIWKKKIYEVLICNDNNDKAAKVIYKLFNSKDAAYAFYENIYEMLFVEYGEK